MNMLNQFILFATNHSVQEMAIPNKISATVVAPYLKIHNLHCFVAFHCLPHKISLLNFLQLAKIPKKVLQLVSVTTLTMVTVLKIAGYTFNYLKFYS